MAVGAFQGEIVFGGTTFSGADAGTPGQRANMIGVKLDGAGAPVWAKAITYLRSGAFMHVTVAPGGGYVASGYVDGDRVDLGAGRVVDGAHAFVAAWSP